MRWRVTGIPSDVRKRARDAAQAAGLPLGPWLERAIGHDLAGSVVALDSAAVSDAPLSAPELAAQSTIDTTIPAATDAPPRDDRMAAEATVDAVPSDDAGPQIRAEKTRLWETNRVRLGAIGAVLLIAGIVAAAWPWRPAPTSPVPQQATIDPERALEAPAASTDAAPELAPPPAPSSSPAGPPEQTAPARDTPPQTAAPRSPQPTPPPATPQTLSEIITGLQRDALNGDAMAQHDLALAYVNGRGVPQNYEIAAGWLEKAAQAGLERAQFNLAVLYENGLGVPQDFKRAFELYNAAAEQGFGPAQHNVAVAYAQGRGTARDYRAAALWFRRAADQNIASAQYNLGMIYEKGLAGPADPQTAYGWYRRAAAAGSEAAVARLAAMEGRIAPAPGDSQSGKQPKPTQAEIAEIQQLLRQLSFDAGPPDGKPGPATRTAIRQYEKVAGLKVTGEASLALLAHLRQVTGMMGTSR